MTPNTYCIRCSLGSSIQKKPKAIKKLNQPVDEYLMKFTDNRQLVDMITQHFFKKTPTFFALSYFGLYMEYFYPKGEPAYCHKH